MSIVNLTPHTITLYDGDGNVLAQIPSSGTRLECEAIRKVTGTVSVEGHALPVTSVTLGELRLFDMATKQVVSVGLPPIEDGTVYLVSRIAAEAAKLAGRTEDFLVPDDTVRKDGQVVGCKALARV